jgi:CRP-like cAMP-binding protein
MRDVLPFITVDDEAHLRPEMLRLTYSPGDTILREGTMGDVLALLRRGRVRMESRVTRRTPFGELHAGELFGESCLVDEEAPVSFVAVDEVEVDLVPRLVLEARMRAEPGFETRLFRSLTWALAGRVRALSDVLVPALALV